jgi:pseudouridine synthase
VQVLSRKKNRTVLEIELREGRKRQIRRMLSLFGHRVTRLTRVRFGPLEIGELRAGTWRELGPDEIQELRNAVGLGGNGAEAP